MRGFLSIRREERWAAGLFLLWQVVLQALVIGKYYPAFSKVVTDYRKTFIDGFHISGFDPLTYCVVSDWSTAFDVNRHPLLAFLYYPFYLLNRGLIYATGVNFAQFIVAAILLFCSFYAFVLMMRIGRELVGIALGEAVILAFLLFSFAYIMLAAVSPDHFVVSLFLLLLVIYITGKQMKEGRRMTKWQTVLFFLLTAGVSLNNGMKAFLASLFSNGKHFFRPGHLLLAVLLPAAAIWGFGEWEYNTFVADGVRAQKVARSKAVRAEKALMLSRFRDTTTVSDSAGQARAFNQIWRNHRKKVLREKAKEPQHAHAGEPISRKRFLNWTDMSTSRLTTVVENLFGESLQLHQQHALDDVMRDRPVVVRYNWIFNYVVEALLFLLFAAGVWAGRKSRLLWLTFSFFALDMVLHLGLGFGINEIYIMTAHWAYVIPVSLGFLLRAATGRKRLVLDGFIVLIALYLAIYNTSLLVNTLYT